MKKNHLSFLYIVLFVLFNQPLFSQDTIRVLFLGNSMTYVEDLPAKLTALAQSDGKVLITEQNTPGGYYLADHTTNSTSLNLLNQNWDYVILQEQSAGLIQPAVPGAYQTPIEFLDSAIRANCAKTLLYITPGYPSNWPADTSYLAMQNKIIQKYRTCSKSVRAGMLATGHAWKNIISNYPSINTGMWASNVDYHPGLKGQYLNACAIFSAIYKKSPQGLVYPIGISPSEASILQQVAWQETKDSIIDFGIDKLDSLQIGFIDSISGLNITLTDTSSSMSNHLIWYWGDGDSSEFVPIVFQPYGIASHSYASDGTYNITQKVWWSECDYKETIKTVTISSLGLNNVKQNNVLIFPNPAHDEIKLNNTNLEIEKTILFNNIGSIVYSREPKNEREITIKVSNFESGIYLIQLKKADGTFIREKIVIE